MNVMMLLEMAASGHGERVAVQSGDLKLSYADLFAAAGSAAAEIRKAGAERLALLDTSGLAVPVGLFASAWAGAPFVPLNYRLTGAEIEGLAARIAPALLVTDSERVTALAGLSGTQVVARDAFLERHLGAEAPAGEWGMDPEAIAILLFTSGTTGVPKAAVLRHKHLVSYILGSIEFGGADPNEAALVSVPPYHIAGMAAILSSVYAGRRIVQLASFDPLELARDRAARAGDPRVRRSDHARAHRRCPRRRPRRGREVAARALLRRRQDAALGDRTRHAALSRHRLHERLRSDRDELDDHAARPRRPSRRGRERRARRAPPAHIGRAAAPEPRARDPRRRRQRLPPGERGEIYVRGEQVSGEYLDQGSRLEAEGWFPTRDGGFLDAAGFLFLDGRIDDVIVRGGENLSPGEIEETLLAHPAVADCAVVGVPDEQWGEAVAAVVVLHAGRKATDEELRAWVSERLRSNRTPSRIQFRDELPFNETGKLLRRVVREELSGEAS